jgi:pimeloyl-ACP methyl ester carboxylesterase
VALEHFRGGSGAPLVLIHGIGCHWQVWNPLLPTDRPPTVGALADAVSAFLSEQGIERPHVAGNSLGGGIALELGRTGRARSVTTLSPVGFWNDRERAYANAIVAATAAAAPRLLPVAGAMTATSAGRALALGHMSRRPWRWPAAAARDLYLAAGRATAFNATLDAIIEWDYLPAEGAVSVPVTIAWAQHDLLLIPRQRHRAARRLPDARHVVLEGCGHLPFWDDPDLVTRVVREGSSAG